MASTALSAISSRTTISIFDLGQEVDGVLAAAVELGVALLAAVTAGLENGHAFDARFEQGVLHCVQLRGLNDRFDLLH
jgi:hypothetical protein